MEGPAAAPHLLGPHDRAHLPVDVEEPDAVGGQLQQSPQVLLEVAHRLLQAEGNGLHPVAPANVHRGAPGPQVHLRQRGQFTILGYKDVVPGRRERRITGVVSLFSLDVCGILGPCTTLFSFFFPFLFCATSGMPGLESETLHSVILCRCLVCTFVPEFWAFPIRLFYLQIK